MTPLNTIIEEEIVRIRTDLKMYEVPYLEAFLTTAMQRAYEAGREERDTYWKERVRKEINKAEEVEQPTGTYDYQSFVLGYQRALDTLLDNLK